MNPIRTLLSSGILATGQSVLTPNAGTLSRLLSMRLSARDRLLRIARGALQKQTDKPRIRIVVD